MLFLTTLAIFDFARSKILSLEACYYAATEDLACSQEYICQKLCDYPEFECETLTCDLVGFFYSDYGMTDFGECFKQDGADSIVTCEDDPAHPCKGSVACMIFCPTSSNGECGEPCMELPVNLDEEQANATCEALEEYSRTSDELRWEECYTPNGTDIMIYCTNSTGEDKALTPSPTTTGGHPENCVAVEEWTQSRADELCPGHAHHAYGVELCEKYDNPDYRRRLQFALANQLYSSCSHACLYDYDSYNTVTPHAFRWTGSCYNVAIGYFCILEELTEMSQSLKYASTLCESSEPCVETIEWSQSVAESNCPDGYGSGGDKGWGTAKVCPYPVRLDNGFYSRADDLYQASFNFSLANHMFWSCSSKCVYDLANPGVVYQWKGQDCWEMQTDWSCITVQWREYNWAANYISESVCPLSTMEPKPLACVDRQENWNEEIAQAVCGVDEMGSTNKGADATVCFGHEDYRQFRLDRSLANRAFMSCKAWCVYDIFDTDGAFIWRPLRRCWEPVTKGLCIFGNVNHRKKITDYIEEMLCESITDEPTHAPTCIPNQEWSEAVMDGHCTVANTGHTYKHYSSVGRAAVPCEKWESYENKLLKSMAMGMFQDCSAWCVYDYYSNATLAWKWSNATLCWDLTTWGSCHFDYSSRTDSPIWNYAKYYVTLFC